MTYWKSSFFLILAGAILLSGCISNSSNIKSEEPVVASILKIQNPPFNPEYKDSIYGAYKDVDVLEVPSNLVPQNKWFMFEGPVLENNLIAYRFYGEHRHRTDIYGKKVNDMVMDTVGWQYHDIMDWGSDILKVGNSLGLGSPAVYVGDTLYTFSDYASKSIAKISEGDRKGFLFKFSELRIANKTIDLEQKWTMVPNRPHARIDIQVTKGSLPEGSYFATGIVKHLPEADFLEKGNKKILATWGKQSYHDQLLGMAVITGDRLSTKVIEYADSHVLGFPYSDSSVSYEMVAAWEKDVMGIKDKEAFLLKVSE